MQIKAGECEEDNGALLDTCVKMKVKNKTKTKVKDAELAHQASLFFAFSSQVFLVCSGQPPRHIREWPLHQLHPPAQRPVVQM